MANVLQEAHVVSKYLQNESMNIATAAAAAFQTLIDTLRVKRSDDVFSKFWDKAVDCGNAIGVEYAQSRQRSFTTTRQQLQ